MRFLRLSVIHPSERSLVRYARPHGDDDAATDRIGGRAVIARHLVRCEACREAVRAMRTIAETAGALRGPEPSPALLERVIAERRSGGRILLPVERAASGDRDVSGGRSARPTALWSGRARVVSAAAAALVLVAGGIWYGRSTAGTPPVRRAPGARDAQGAVSGGDAAMPTFAAAHTHGDGFFAVALLPAAAYAQPLRAPTDIVSLDAHRIRSGRWTYELRIPGRDSARREQGVIAIDRVQHGTRSEWSVYDTWLGHPDDMVDSVFYDAESLRVARRSARRVGPSQYTVAQRFVGDSVLGVMQATRYRAPTPQPIRRVLPQQGRRYGAGDGFLHVLLQGAHLDPAWRARVALVGWGAVPSDLVYPVDLRVTGDTTLTIAGAATSAWTIAMSAGSNAKTVWARKRDGIPLRIAGHAGPERGWIITLVQETTGSTANDRMENDR